jgi:hypothetical protein
MFVCCNIWHHKCWPWWSTNICDDLRWLSTVSKRFDSGTWMSWLVGGQHTPDRLCYFCCFIWKLYVSLVQDLHCPNYWGEEASMQMTSSCSRSQNWGIYCCWKHCHDTGFMHFAGIHQLATDNARDPAMAVWRCNSGCTNNCSLPRLLPWCDWAGTVESVCYLWQW